MLKRTGLERAVRSFNEDGVVIVEKKVIGKFESLQMIYCVKQLKGRMAYHACSCLMFCLYWQIEMNCENEHKGKHVRD